MKIRIQSRSHDHSWNAGHVLDLKKKHPIVRLLHLKKWEREHSVAPYAVELGHTSGTWYRYTLERGGI